MRYVVSAFRSAFVTCALVATTAVGQDVQARFAPDVERAATELFSEVMSPYCPGMTLTTCPSPQSAVMKDSIRRVLAEGETPDGLMAGLERIYGPEIRAKPPARGMGLVAWVAPFALLGLGGIGLTWWLRDARTRQASSAVAPGVPMDPPLDESTRSRLAAALREDG